MDLTNPISSVIPGVQGVVLSVLANTETPLTGLTIAKLTDGRASTAGVKRALRVLVEAGLVISVTAGRAHQYSLNVDHVAHQEITGLSQLREMLFERMVAAVGCWEPPAISVAVFGSTARRTAGAPSDLDVFVVRPSTVSQRDEAWASNISEFALAVTRWSGNACDVLEYDGDELVALSRKGDPLIRSLVRDAIVLYGASVADVIGGRAR